MKSILSILVFISGCISPKQDLFELSSWASVQDDYYQEIHFKNGFLVMVDDFLGIRINKVKKASSDHPVFLVKSGQKIEIIEQSSLKIKVRIGFNEFSFNRIEQVNFDPSSLSHSDQSVVDFLDGFDNRKK